MEGLIFGFLRYKNETSRLMRGVGVTLVLHSTGPRAGLKKGLSSSGPSV